MKNFNLFKSKIIGFSVIVFSTSIFLTTILNGMMAFHEISPQGGEIPGKLYFPEYENYKISSKNKSELTKNKILSKEGYQWIF